MKRLIRSSQKISKKPIKSSTISKSDIEKLMKFAVDVHTRDELIKLLGSLLSYDKELYQHYSELERSGEYSPAAIGKMISDELYADYIYWYKDVSSSIKASYAGGYTDHFNYSRGGTKFSIYSKYTDDPYNFQCQITEIHPYDDADYYWVKKDGPASASLIKNNKRVGYIDIDEYDEDYYETPGEYIDDIIDYMCVELKNYNKTVEPKIIHN